MKAINLRLTIFIFFCIFAVTDINAQNFFNNNEQSQPTIIELLENGESYSIEITSIGCFHGERETVVVSKESDVYTVQYQDFSKILSEKDIEAFIRFELQLKALQMGGCTTVDTYVVRYKGEEFRTSDGTCSWQGGKKLLKAIS